jgi:hypothetical protein
VIRHCGEFLCAKPLDSASEMNLGTTQNTHAVYTSAERLKQGVLKINRNEDQRLRLNFIVQYCWFGLGREAKEHV